MSPEQKLKLLDTSKLGPRTTVAAVTASDTERCEITLRLHPQDFEKLDPDNIAIVKLEW